MNRVVSFFFSLVLLLGFASHGATTEALTCDTPESLGLDSRILQLIDAAVETALTERKMPGCVVCVGRHGKIAFLKSYGNKQVATTQTPAMPMTVDTIFDLASLTKPIATATSIMVLVEQNKLDVDAPVAQYLNEFNTPEKHDITIRHLLTHTAGFIPDNALRDYQDGAEKARERLLSLKPTTNPGTQYRYSDVSFQVLGEVILRVTGKNVHEFSREHVFLPLGMTETTYIPDETLSQRAAPTQDRELGKVHDPRAFLTDGIAGHAGLFSTAKDLALYASMMLDKTGILKQETVELMIRPNRVSESYRGLGWDSLSGSSNRGTTMSPQAFGHGGFTGTSIWIDPAFDIFVIFLSNRVHPDGNGSVNPLAGKIGTIAVDSVTKLPANTDAIVAAVKKSITHYRCQQSVTVLPGIDVLRQDQFAILRGKRIGLITNHTGVTKNGTPIYELLHKEPGLELTTLFSPEHGFAGVLDNENITDSREPTTGLPVFSLYGKFRKPTPNMLDNIDILVFDIQDIGSRFYTYISTMLGAMESAAMKGIPLVVLDRPNPIRGDAVEGPLLEAGRETTVGCFRLPLRHGMTVGELALQFNVERRLGLDLHVVPALGWNREDDYSTTQLPWINPSPNMRSLTAAYLYPGVGLIEFTNIAVGRGTETPFEQIGAPWIDADQLTAALSDAAKKTGLHGIRFEPVRFTPDASKFNGELCHGVRFVLDDDEAFQPVRLGLVIISTLRHLYRDQWDTNNLDTLLLQKTYCDMLREGKAVKSIEAEWQPELDEFLERREHFMLYYNSKLRSR